VHASLPSDRSHRSEHTGFQPSVSAAIHVPGIDGLRAIAVLAVLIFHAAPHALPGGFVGVDVFFVLSGYVVTATLVRHREDSWLQFFTGFYARRVLRIAPALLVCLLTTVLASAALVPQTWQSTIHDQTGLQAFYGLSNLALASFAQGYFDAGMDFNPFTHTWSLAVEEQFYLVFPGILFVWLRWQHDRGVRGWAARAALPSLFAASLVTCAIESSGVPQRAFYLLPARFWELAAGALLLQAHQRGRLLAGSSRAAHRVLLAGIGAIALSLSLASERAFPFPWALLPVAGAVLGVSAAVALGDRMTGPARMLVSRPVLYVGAISYSLYLWHWPVFALLRWTLGMSTPAQIALGLTLAAGLAVLSYHVVERPLRRSAWALSLPSWKLVLGGVAACTSCFLVSSRVFQSREHFSLSVTTDRAAWQPIAWFEIAKGLDVTTRPAPGRLIVLGDSHAGSYSTLMRSIWVRQGIPAMVFTIPGCGLAHLLWTHRGNAYCKERIEAAIAAVEQEARPDDTIFLASLRTERIASPAGEPYRSNPDSDESVFERELALDEARELLARLHRRTSHLLINAPTPVFPAPAFRCSDWFNRDNPSCAAGLTQDRDALLDGRKGVMESLRRLQSEFPDLTVWDPFPVLCPGNPCSAFDAEGPLFFDGDHLSGHGNDVLHASFLQVLDRVWGPGTTRAEFRPGAQ
jgi:peptidoglycan/LPS O-acetylase OafA/YrhL